MVPLRLRLIFSFTIVALIGLVPLWYRSGQLRDFRNFHVVTDGVLYRSAQLSTAGFQRAWNDYRFKTVVCIREGNRTDDQVEESFCKDHGIQFVRLAPRNWGPIDGIVPADNELARFFEVMDDPASHPVLIHCFAGAHRTGAYVAVYRMEYDGWSNEQAIAEMRDCGYKTLDGDLDINEFLRTYRPHHVRRSVSAQTVSRAVPADR